MPLNVPVHRPLWHSLNPWQLPPLGVVPNDPHNGVKFVSKVATPGKFPKPQVIPAAQSVPDCFVEQHVSAHVPLVVSHNPERHSEFAVHVCPPIPKPRVVERINHFGGTQ